MSHPWAKPLIVNVIHIAVLAFVEALQILILAAVVLNFIPIPAAAFVKKLFPIYVYDVRPEREMLLYRLFVVVAIALQAALVYLWRHKLEQGDWAKVLRPYIVVMAAGVLVQLVAVFKFIVFGNPAWAKALLYISLVASIAARIFWPELRRLLNVQYSGLVKKLIEMGLLAFILSLVFVPDIQRLLARDFIYDHFYHFDSMLMSPAWAQLKGLTLNVDVGSEYSVVIPFVFGHLAQVFGGFDYGTVMAMLMITGLVYYVLFYCFVRAWLNSVPLALAALLLILKLQLFHWGISPLVWQLPSTTPLRYFPDIFIMFCLWRHMATGRNMWLWPISIGCGIALTWMVDVGVYLSGMWIAYMGILCWQKKISLRQAGTWLTVALLVAVGILLSIQGPVIFTAPYWARSQEFVELFLHGWGATPMYEGLKEKYFFAMVMGFLIPAGYVVTLLWASAMAFYRRSEHQFLFVAMLCLYGLGLYHYYIHRSGFNSYYVVAVPWVMVLAFWVRQAAKRVQLAIAAAIALGLTTAFLFTYYPNIWNLAQVNWAQENMFFQQNFDFKPDADLISKLTSVDDRVALISSFETKMLMQADRKPFFYYFPMNGSNAMLQDEFQGLYLHTQERLDQTIRQLEEGGPAYIFIEKKIITDPQGARYQEKHVALKKLLAYVAAHYQPQAQGQYLVAFKRKL